MKLKPSLFQLIVILMTSSLIVSCNTYPQGSQVDCNDPKAKQSQECNPSSTRNSGAAYRGTRSSTIIAPLQGNNQGQATQSGNSTSGNDTSAGANPANNSSDSSSATKGSSSGSDSHSTSNSSSKSGRGGFGSFSSGKAGG